ncbi:MAG TPA: malic enzyme-like NAD(P)-binding protein [Gammaproteobacteria bacterium]|nr:malic enzyme-like NAD(P)-binding protein [Gammaproteobacteria bacterium]
MTKDLRKAALLYHSNPVPGKIAILSTKPTLTQDDLSLCYTPGVAEPVKEIVADPAAAFRYTSKGNLVAVITNGTAVLGLGNAGALASKPVMEGKAVLFKLFADIDVFDIEIDCEDPQGFIETVTRIAPTFGAINLEDIKAPECFEIEKALKEKLSIPVFHDDQHGTAIVIAAGLLNALELQGKSLDEVTIVCAGAGAAGIAAMRLLMQLGAKRTHLLMVDRAGVIHAGRKDLNIHKQTFAIETDKRTLMDALTGADVFIGVSGPGLMTPDMLRVMADRPIVFALSNPTPEIMPEIAYEVRNDLIMATGRSDYPNQVNNALCFPYIFRGALDVHASCINEAMQLAAVHAIKNLVQEPVPPSVLAAYSLQDPLVFGPDYILPKLLDPRLKECVSRAVSEAAIKSGVSSESPCSTA